MRLALPETEKDVLSRCSGLNRGPTVYETVALPLSYTGEKLERVGTYAIPAPGVNGIRGHAASFRPSRETLTAFEQPRFVFVNLVSVGSPTKNSGLGPVALMLAALSLTSTTGCSWIFVQPLPEDHRYRDEYQPCTSSVVAPVFDTLFTLTNLGSALYVASEDNVTNKGTAVTLGVGVAILWAASAAYGYSHTAECQEAHEFDERGYRPPPHLRAPPRYYQQPPPRIVAPPPPPPAQEDAPPSPGSAPPAPAVAPQQNDDDAPENHRPAPDPSWLEPQPPTKKQPAKPGERLDAPRFGG
jgi:hypothetical protein